MKPEGKLEHSGWNHPRYKGPAPQRRCKAGRQGSECPWHNSADKGKIRVRKENSGRKNYPSVFVEWANKKVNMAKNAFNIIRKLDNMSANFKRVKDKNIYIYTHRESNYTAKCSCMLPQHGAALLSLSFYKEAEDNSQGGLWAILTSRVIKKKNTAVLPTHVHVFSSDPPTTFPQMG